jgi:hypothetical protein
MLVTERRLSLAIPTNEGAIVKCLLRDITELYSFDI